MADTHVGKYRVERVLGAGAFGTVWLATDEVLESSVAIKVLADNWARNPDIRRRFVDEAKVLRHIEDDRIVRIYEIDELADGRPYFVMAYADRGTLTDRIRQRVADKRLHTPEEAVALLTELCECLTVVHDGGIVHRDLKPSNILFRSRGRRTSSSTVDDRMVLGDFGLAKDLVVASGFTLAAGTPAYMAPEQTRASAELDHRADLYAAAAVFHELLAGAPPFDDASMVEVAQRQGAQAAARLVVARPDLPPGLVALVERGLDARPERRFASAAELAATAREALGGAGASAVAPASPTTELAAPPPMPGVRGRIGELLAGLERRTGIPSVRTARQRLEDPCRVLAVTYAGGPAIVPMLDGRFDAAIAEHVLGPDARPVAEAADADVVAVALPDDPASANACVDAVLGPLRRAPAGPVAVIGVTSPAAHEALAGDRNLARRVVPLLSSAADGAVRDAVGMVMRRADTVRASAALALTDAALRAERSPEVAAAGAQLDQELEPLRWEVPALGEMDVLRRLVAGRVTLPGDAAATRRLLLAPDPASRLGLATGASNDEVRRAAEQVLSHWRALLNDRVGIKARPSAEVLIHSVERMWAATR
ncbi:MAG: serine/threonine-protein kinase [Actinomycetota bacterium]|nr:serine/threonine-protein kinase [Actinomycetota bacterium]